MAAEEITALFVLKNHGRMGRYLLSSMSGLGEGVARRVLESLRDSGAVKVSKGGAEITDRGEEILKELLNYIAVKQVNEVSNFNRVLMCECTRCIAALLSVSVPEDNVVKLRDEAIKGGSDAALFLRFSCPENKFKILRLSNYLSDFDKNLEEKLIVSLAPKCDEDVVVLCGANYYRIIKSLIHVMSLIRQP